MNGNAIEIDVEILPDGRLRVITGDLHGPHHAKADELLKLMIQLMGGKVEVKSRKGHSHTHTHHTHKHTH